MELRIGVHGYGKQVDAGVYECADCGHHYAHAKRAPLPPCPRYADTTHTRAAWRPQAATTAEREQRG